MKCDNCKKELNKKFSYSIPAHTHGNRNALLLCCKKCMEEKVKQLEERYGKK